MRVTLPTSVRKAAAFWVLVMSATWVGSSAAQGGEILTNESVVQLTTANVDPAVIVSTIESSRSRFGVGITDIVALSRAHVSREVITAMQAAVARGGQPKAGMGASSAIAVTLPTEFGTFIVDGDAITPLPIMNVTVAQGTDQMGRPQLSAAFRGSVRPKLVVGKDLAFIVFVRDPANVAKNRLMRMSGPPPTIRLYEVPVRQAPVGSDSRMVRMVPAQELDPATYLILNGDDPSKAFMFQTAQGQLNPPRLTRERASRLAGAAPPLHSTLALPAAMDVVRQVLSSHHLGIADDFDTQGVLTTVRAAHVTGMLGVSSAVQFVVKVESTSAGTDFRIGADAFSSGSTAFALSRADLDTEPLVASDSHSQRQAEWLRKEIEKALSH
jgi:hypothetical protein